MSMKRTDRLLNLLQVLRRHRRPVTAEVLAAEMDVSVRTIYRDMAGLLANRVPIRGEAGIGYVLEPGYDLPPMMLNIDEIEALLVGMRWLRGRADSTLARAAEDVVAKVGAMLPKDLRPVLLDGALFAPNFSEGRATDSIDVALIRQAIRKGKKLEISYADVNGAMSQRIIWPFGMAYLDYARMVMAWCEKRQAFRNFRTDRISQLDLLPESYPVRRAELLKRWEREEKYKPRPQTRDAATIAKASG